LKNKVPFRDRVVTLSSPFTTESTEITKTEWRFTFIQYTDKGVAMLSEFDRPTRHVRTWLLDGGEKRQAWDRKQERGDTNPGPPVTRRQGGAIVQFNDTIYLIGQGASPEGDRPFLDRLNLKTLQSERLFHSAADAYEMPIAPLNDDASLVLRRRETPKD